MALALMMFIIGIKPLYLRSIEHITFSTHLLSTDVITFDHFNYTAFITSVETIKTTHQTVQYALITSHFHHLFECSFDDMTFNSISTLLQFSKVSVYFRLLLVLYCLIMKFGSFSKRFTFQMVLKTFHFYKDFRIPFKLPCHFCSQLG